MKRIVLIFLILVLSSCRVGSYRHLQDAEEFSRKGEFESAIVSYRKHMEIRLKNEKRPEWENPHFYRLIIGDMLLGLDRPNDALLEYEEAEKSGVDKGLTGDRYRYTATWYESKGNLEAALEVLKKYRDRDPLLFDLMLDRIARELVLREESAPLTDTPTPTPDA